LLDRRRGGGGRRIEFRQLVVSKLRSLQRRSLRRVFHLSSRRSRRERGLGERQYREEGLLRHDAGDAPAGQPQPPQHLALQPATPHLPCLLLLRSVCTGAGHHLWPPPGPCSLLVPTGSALYSAFTATNRAAHRTAAAPWWGACFERASHPKCLPRPSYSWDWLLHFWPGRK